MSRYQGAGGIDFVIRVFSLLFEEFDDTLLYNIKKAHNRVGGYNFLLTKKTK